MDYVRRDTAGSPAPTFLDTNCEELSTFTACTSPELRRIINSSPSSTCELDPAPTFIVKEFLDTLLPLLTVMCNASLQEGCIPSSQTKAVFTPRLKKLGLDPLDIKNCRPISNLSFMS